MSDDIIGFMYGARQDFTAAELRVMADAQCPFGGDGETDDTAAVVLRMRLAEEFGYSLWELMPPQGGGFTITRPLRPSAARTFRFPDAEA